MPLENILQSIEQRKEAEIERITAKYNEQASALEKETEKRIRDIASSSARRSADDCRSLENMELSNAQIEARRLIWEKRAELVELSLAKAFDLVKDIRSSKSYRKMMTEMVDLARRKLGEECTVRVSKEDISLIRSAKGVTVKTEEVDPYGGLIGESRDGSMEMDLTVTTLIRDIRDALSLELYERIGAK